MKKSLKGAGFTLIEMIIVIAIIGVLSVMILVNYRVSQKQHLLERGRQEAINHLRRAQNMALASLEYGGQVPAGGYGLHFEQGIDSYILFADKVADKVYDLDDDEKIQTINLPGDEKIIISGLIPGTPLDIVFIPPAPETFINTGIDDGKITLQETSSGDTRTITITNQGVID